MDPEPKSFINQILNWIMGPNQFMKWNLKQYSNQFFYRLEPLDDRRIKYPYTYVDTRGMMKGKVTYSYVRNFEPLYLKFIL